MIIEFVGLPASGKSTLARQVVDRLSTAEFGVVPGPSAIVRRPIRFASSLYRLRRLNGSVSVRLLATNAVEFAQRSTRSTTILDQGPVQRLVSASWVAALPEHEVVTLLSRQLDSDRVLVHVDVPAAVAADRLGQRRKRVGRFASLEGPELFEALSWHRRVLSHLDVALTVAGTGVPEETCKAIMSALNLEARTR